MGQGQTYSESKEKFISIFASLKKEYVKKRNYRVWLFLLSPHGPAFWEWDSWLKVSEVVDPLVKLTRGKSVMDIFQTSKTGRKVNQGALLWNLKNMQKWTHHSPLTNDFTHELDFDFVDVWCPSQVQCNEDNLPPDLFFQLQHLTHPSYHPSEQVNQIVTLAVAQDIADLHAVLIDDCLCKLESLLNPTLLAELTSRWVIKRAERAGQGYA